MPYVQEDIRVDIELGMAPQSVGQLTYALTIPIRNYLRYIQSLPVGSLRYEHLADVVAALDNCKSEFYRQVIAPYEDTKITENGDIDWGTDSGRAI